MRKCAAIILLAVLVLISGCMPAGMTFNDFIPTPTPQATTALAPAAATSAPAAQAPATPVVTPTPAATFTPQPGKTSGSEYSPLPSPSPFVLSAPFEAAVRELYALDPSAAITRDMLKSVVRIALYGEGLEAAADPYLGEYWESPPDGDTLYVAYDEAINMTDLLKFDRLYSLSFVGIDGIDLQLISTLGAEQLEFMVCSLDGLGALENMKSLRKLSIEVCDLNEIADLAALVQLSALDVSGNNLTGLFDGSEFSALEYLDISGNRLKDVSEAFTFPALTHLNMAFNRIYTIEGIAPETLQVLDITDNAITSIAPLRPLVALTELYIGDNPLSTLKPMRYLKALQYADISKTTASGISWIRKIGFDGLTVDAEQFKTSTVYKLMMRGVMIAIAD